MCNIKIFQDKKIRSVWNEEEERMKQIYEQKGYPKDWKGS